MSIIIPVNVHSKEGFAFPVNGGFFVDFIESRKKVSNIAFVRLIHSKVVNTEAELDVAVVMAP